MSALEFDWDAKNVDHLALHQISPEETEEVVKNRPRDLDEQLRYGEMRTIQVGETDAGRILIVVVTMVGQKVRIVTAWPAKEQLRRYFLSQKRNGNVGRVEN